MEIGGVIYMLDKFIKWFCSIGDVAVSTINEYSFGICLLVGLVALILSVFGYEKGKKVATLSPAVYIIIQIFLKGWFGV